MDWKVSMYDNYSRMESQMRGSAYVHRVTSWLRQSGNIDRSSK